MPDVEIMACSTYDFLLSLQVALASPEYDYADYDVGSRLGSLGSPSL